MCALRDAKVTYFDLIGNLMLKLMHLHRSLKYFGNIPKKHSKIDCENIAYWYHSVLWVIKTIFLILITVFSE